MKQYLLNRRICDNFLFPYLITSSILLIIRDQNRHPDCSKSQNNQGVYITTIKIGISIFTWGFLAWCAFRDFDRIWLRHSQCRAASAKASRRSVAPIAPQFSKGICRARKRRFQMPCFIGLAARCFPPMQALASAHWITSSCSFKANAWHLVCTIAMSRGAAAPLALCCSCAPTIRHGRLPSLASFGW